MAFIWWRRILMIWSGTLPGSFRCWPSYWRVTRVLNLSLKISTSWSRRSPSLKTQSPNSATISRPFRMASVVASLSVWVLPSLSVYITVGDWLLSNLPRMVTPLMRSVSHCSALLRSALLTSTLNVLVKAEKRTRAVPPIRCSAKSLYTFGGTQLAPICTDTFSAPQRSGCTASRALTFCVSPALFAAMSLRRTCPDR